MTLDTRAQIRNVGSGPLPNKSPPRSHTSASPRNPPPPFPQSSQTPPFLFPSPILRASPFASSPAPPPLHSSVHPPRRRPRRRAIHPSSHGAREQQHHGVRDAASPNLRGARDRLGDLVRVGAGRRVRAPGAVARRHPRRPPPPGRPRGLRRCVLEPPPPPRLLPLLHGGAHSAPHRAPRLRLRRHTGLRGVPGPGPRLRGLPPRRVLHVAPWVRLRRPWTVGEDQGLPRRLRYLQEAREAGSIRQRRAVLPVQPVAATVGVLQAAVGVRVQLREPDGVDGSGAAGGGPGLWAVEQRPVPALLRVRVLQGGAPGGAPRPVAQGQHRARRRHRLPRHPLPHRLQRLQERPGRRLLPPLQVIRRSLESCGSPAGATTGCRQPAGVAARVTVCRVVV